VVVRYRISRPAEAKIEESLAYALHHFGIAGAARYRALIYQAFQDLAANWATLLRSGQAKAGDGLLVYPLRMSRRNVPRSIAMVGKPRGFIVGRVDEDGVLVVLGFVGEGMRDADVEGGISRATELGETDASRD
jgi:plasmid stabilization system protein ParE